MKTYKVIKPFFKLSDRTNYKIGETIDLTDMEAEAKKYEGLISDIIHEKALINNKIVDVEIVEIKGKRIGSIKKKKDD